jgi:hypothetical protein
VAAAQDPAARAKAYPLFVPPDSELSMKHPLLVEGTQAAPAGPPKLASVAVKPTFEYAALYETSAELMLRNEPTADDSSADTRARIKFGTAIAAMIRMIATTISSSISENPFFFRIRICPSCN